MPAALDAKCMGLGVAIGSCDADTCRLRVRPTGSAMPILEGGAPTRFGSGLGHARRRWFGEGCRCSVRLGMPVGSRGPLVCQERTLKRLHAAWVIPTGSQQCCCSGGLEAVFDLLVHPEACAVRH